MQTNSRRSFLSGVSVLTFSALVVKVIGLFYRIPLLGVLGTEGMGYFNTAYELYALFCVVATAGLPVAMSVLISARSEAGHPADARRIYRVARGAFLVIGLVGTGLLWGLSGPFATLLGNPGAAVCMRAIAPTVFLICLSSAYRGYFQGHRRMTPTALSQIVEAAGKLLLGLLFAYYARVCGYALPVIAAFAVLGLTVGTALSVLYLALHKHFFDRHTPSLPATASQAPARIILRALAATAIPVTLSAGVIGLAKCIDLALILRRLQDVGYTANRANALYGCYSTLAVPVFNILPSLATSVALSAVPTLAAAFGCGDTAATRRTALSALRVTLLAAIPAALGLSVFAEDILALLFSGQPAAVAEAAPWLSCLGLSVPAACLVTVTGGMLQAAGHASRPLISMGVAVAIKTVLAYLLLGMEGVGMMGAPLSSLVCDTVIVCLNLLFLARHAPAMIPDRRVALGLFLRPTLAAVAAVTAVRFLRRTCGWDAVTTIHTLGTVVAVMCLYGACVLLLHIPRRAITQPDQQKGPSKHEQTDKTRA